MVHTTGSIIAATRGHPSTLQTTHADTAHPTTKDDATRASSMHRPPIKSVEVHRPLLQDDGRRCRHRLVAGCSFVVFLLLATLALGWVGNDAATSVYQDTPQLAPTLPLVFANDPAAAVLCAPFQAVRSMAGAAYPAVGVVYCTHNVSDDVFVSASLVHRGYWSNCLKAIHVLDMVASAQQLLQTPPTRRVVIDVGANIGACTVLFAAHRHRWGVGHILALEPASSNYAVLQATIAANHGMRRAVTLVHAAAGRLLPTDTTPGRRRIYLERGNLGNAAMLSAEHTTQPSSIRNASGTASDGGLGEDVLLTTIDHEMERMQQGDHVGGYNASRHGFADDGAAAAILYVPFMKVDVQGFEPSVLQGAESLLTDRRVGSIMLEVDVDLSRKTGHTVDHALRLLFTHKYRIFYWDKELVQVVNRVVAGVFIANGFWERRVVRELSHDGLAPFVRLCIDAPQDVIAISEDLVLTLGGGIGVSRRLRKFSDHGVLRALKQKLV